MSNSVHEFQIENNVMFFERPEKWLIDCAYHQTNDTNHLFVTIPGVDGSHNGYMNKYISMAEYILANSKSSVLRTSNPYISSFHWDTNFERLMEYIEANLGKYEEVSIFAVSAGASVVAKLAHKYPKIKRLVLCSMAKDLHQIGIKEGLNKFSGNIEIYYGDQDPNHTFISELEPLDLLMKTKIFNNCDHYFSGDNLETFIKLPLYSKGALKS